MNALAVYEDLLKNECINDAKYFNENESFEAFLSVFDDIPSEEIRNVMTEFICLVANYKRNSKTPMNFTTYTQTRPDKAIISDIKIIKDYQEWIERVYPIQRKVTTLKEVANIFGITENEVIPVYEVIDKNEVNANNPSNLHGLIPQELINAYEYNKKIIADLESRAFQIIHDLRYHKEKPITKSYIKIFMEEVRKKYVFKTVDVKALIDNI